MTMASLTASLLARKGHAQPSASARDIFAPDSNLDGQRRQSPLKPKPHLAATPARKEQPKEPANEQLCSSPAPQGEEQTPPRPMFAPSEARHTRLVQTDEVVRKPAQKAQKTRQATADTRKHKSLRLDDATDTQLRLLAARKATSQQALMEEALQQYLEKETKQGCCLCGSQKA